MPTRRRVVQLLGAGAAASVGSPVLAQAAWPSKPIRLICPFPPGGAADALMRQLARPLAASIGQTVLVDNKAGAGGAIGLAETARAEPDGHTIGMGAVGVMAVTPSIPGAKMLFDPAKDLQPIIRVSEQPNVLVAHPSVPAKGIAEFTAWARGNPQEANFGSPGQASANHITGELIGRTLKAPLTHIAYKGSGPAQVDLLGGTIKLMVDNLAGVAALIKAGKLNALVVSTGRRAPALPDVPTLAEIGAKGMDLPSWQGIFAPVGVPWAILRKLNTALQAALKDAAVVDWMAKNGVEGPGGTAEEFRAFVAAQRVVWAKLVTEYKITGE